MKPYYDHAGITIYHGDCRDVLSCLGAVGFVVTDPPYPDCHVERYGYSDGLVDVLDQISVRQFVFWSAKVDFPLAYTAIHVWDKKTGCGSEYERIFERNGSSNWKVFRHYLINSTVAAMYSNDVFTGHPSQKPQRLIRDIFAYASVDSVLLDPFCGTGVTLEVAKAFRIKAIGIEIDERYCEIAANRLEQEVLPFDAVSA
jgi:site-specific DNA-methyltransferase (adenine-specific)